MAVIVRASNKKEALIPKNKKFHVNELIDVLGQELSYLQRYNQYIVIFNSKAEENCLAINFNVTNFIGYSQVIFGDAILAEYKELY